MQDFGAIWRRDDTVEPFDGDVITSRLYSCGASEADRVPDERAC